MTTKYLFSLFLAAQFLFVHVGNAAPKSPAMNYATQALTGMGMKSGHNINFQKIEKFLKNDPQLYENFRRLLTVLKVQGGMSFEMLSFEKDGKEYPRIALRSGTTVMHMDFYGEPERFLRFADVNFVQTDLADPRVFFSKLTANNEALRKSMIKQLLNEPIEMNQRLWAFLTPYDQVMFIVNLRMVHGAASAVLDKYKIKQRGTAGLEKLFIEVAQAAPPDESNSCIVGGWESTYKDNAKCSEDLADLKDKTGNLTCADGGFPCRPALFGVDDSGGPICISRNRAVLNLATKECDSKTPLTEKKNIDNLLRARGVSSAALTSDQVKSLTEGFNKDIDRAISICSGAKDIDPNQKNNPDSACEVLGSRKLAFQNALNGLNVQAAAAAPPQVQAAKGSLGCGGTDPAPGAPGAGGGVVNGIVGPPPPCPASPQIPPAVNPPAAAGALPPGVGVLPTPGSKNGSTKTDPGFFSEIWNWIGDHKGVVIGVGVLVAAGIGLYYATKVKKVSGNPTSSVAPAAPPNTGSLTTTPITTSNMCCLINGVWVMDSNNCSTRLNVTSTNSDLSLCGGSSSGTSSITTQRKATTAPVKKGRR